MRSLQQGSSNIEFALEHASTCMIREVNSSRFMLCFIIAMPIPLDGAKSFAFKTSSIYNCYIHKHKIKIHGKG